MLGVAVRRGLSAAGRLLFPPVCAGCGSDALAHGHLCADCWREAEFLSGVGCRSCSRPLEGRFDADAWEDRICDVCLDHPPLWDRGTAVAHYAGTMRRLILRLKHGDRVDLAPILAAWAVRSARPLLAEADHIVPVPAHWRRRLKRRYNQAAEVARAMARLAGRSRAYQPSILTRRRATPTQEGRDREGRAANLADAISVTRRWRGALTGARVLLVDDVLTTGATLNVAASALRGAGVAGIDVVVLALVPRSGLGDRLEDSLSGA